MSRFHSIWALLFVTVFLATGVYMRAVFPDAYRGNETMRMLYRSAHVYILLGAFINAAYAINLRVPQGTRRWLCFLGSLFIALAPLIFTLAFFFEPAPDRHDRPWSLTGTISAFAGVILATLASHTDDPSQSSPR